VDVDGSRFLAAALFDRRSRPVREGHLRLTSAEPVADGIAALAGLLAQGEPSELVALGPPPLPRPPPALTLHYHRPDGRYDDLRLVAWEAVVQSSLREAQPRTTNVPGSAFPGALPAGHDAFGAFWWVAGPISSGRINLILRHGGGHPSALGFPPEDDERPNRYSLRYWIVADGPEAWVNAPTCEAFTTEEAAVRGWSR
jgi:hypothetical protein